MIAALNGDDLTVQQFRSHAKSNSIDINATDEVLVLFPHKLFVLTVLLPIIQILEREHGAYAGPGWL